MRRFSLYQHPSGIIYTLLFDAKTGARLLSRSKGKRDRDDAAVVAHMPEEMSSASFARCAPDGSYLPRLYRLTRQAPSPFNRPGFTGDLFI
jgi:hypothetical protein